MVNWLGKLPSIGHRQRTNLLGKEFSQINKKNTDILQQKLKNMSRPFTESANGSTWYKKMFNLPYNQKMHIKNLTKIKVFTNRFRNYTKKCDHALAVMQRVWGTRNSPSWLLRVKSGTTAWQATWLWKPVKCKYKYTEPLPQQFHF